MAKGKRVGLITNPTGIDANMKSSVDLLFEHPNIKITALYGPEHGVRGDAQAGEGVESYTDEKQVFLFTLFMEKQENQLLKC